jgi:hypothetical protein
MLDQRNLTPREALARAIVYHRRAIENNENAAQAALRGKSMLNDALLLVGAYSELDNRITAVRAERVKAWTAGSVPSLELPDDLKGALAGRDRAAEDAASASDVFKSLSADAESSAAALKQAEEALGRAAQGVLAETAEEVADELARVQALTDALRFRLRGFCSVTTVLLSERARELAQFPRAPYLVPNLNPERREIDNIFGYHRRLLTDPDSVLDQPSS